MNFSIFGFQIITREVFVLKDFQRVATLAVVPVGMPTITGWLPGMATLPAVPVCAGWARHAHPPRPAIFVAVGR